MVEYALSAANSQAPPIGLPSMTRGSDGNIWFLEVFQQGADVTSRLARVTPSGSITEFPLPGSSVGTEAITGGPDGNVWMVGESATAAWIRRVTLGGSVTDFPLTTGAAPTAITAGPDGNVWFTEFQRGKIGRITPAGALTEFPIPASSRRPSGITAGPDGNLWFVEVAWNDNAVARITPTGDVIEYPIPANELKIGNYDPAMAAGADGAIWFDSPNSFGIDRITPAGVVSQFPLPGLSCARALAAGPDGNLWFTDPCGRSVGRIKSGAIRQFDMPSLLGAPVAIAAGSDGRIWFTESGVNRVASIGLTVPQPSLSSLVMNFGRPPGPASQTVQVTNIGDASLNIASATITGPDAQAFAKSSDNCSGHPLPIGATCQVAVEFKPAAGAGLRAASLQFVDDATGSPHTVSLIAEPPDCRLPLVDRISQASAQGKFLDLISGEVSTDPAGLFTWVADQQQYHTATEPILYGSQSNFSYDRALDRWLPVMGNTVSPDGSTYAFTGVSPTDSGEVHVVDVRSGRDRILPGLAGIVLAFGREGIYVSGFDGGSVLWLVNPDSGAKSVVFRQDGVEAVADGAAWIADLNPDDPAPPQFGIGGPGNDQVLRRDLTTGTVSTWFYRPGTAVQVVAAIGGRLLVSSHTEAGDDYWVVSGPTHADRLTIDAQGDPFQFEQSGTLSGDALGLWLEGPMGIYLWTARTGLVLVSNAHGIPAGPCS